MIAMKWYTITTDMDIAFNLNTLLSVAALIGTTVVSVVVKRNKDAKDEIREDMKEVKQEVIRQGERIDKIYDHLIGTHIVKA